MTAPSETIIIDYEEVNYKREAKEALRAVPGFLKDYFVGLLPILQWIHRYNLQWLMRDLIAGITVGIVVVPQSMGYAKIANLPPQYGLYTAFVGLCVYCLFATSKDISIGPTAVMSLLVGQTVTHVAAQYDAMYTAPQVAVAFSIMTGAIATFIGLARLGILVDLIPGPAIAGFMTGSALSISIGQWPKLFGIKTVNTQDSTYLVFGHFFQHLPDTKVDVAFGLIGLLWLYGIRFGCDYLSKRYPRYSTVFFYLSIMRNGVLVILSTLISFLINIGKTTSPFSILKTVPAGFQAMGVPQLDTGIIGAIASQLPSGVIVLIMEHVAIAKSFGRINDYNINPNQEIIAIGFTNIWSAFFGAYPSTGSFSRTAIKARSGVKTPIAGVFSALVVVLALYALTPAFYYIPDACLSAVVIHAVSDLVSGPTYIKRLAAVSLWELLVFATAVIVTFFTTVDYGIYASVGLSAVILLFRIARPHFSILVRVPLEDKDRAIAEFLYVPENHPSLTRFAEHLPRGIIMFRIEESMTYPNSSYFTESLICYCKKHTRRSGKPLSKGDRAWNDDANPKKDAERAQLPRLHAIIFDFQGVNRLDSSGLQAIIDVQNTLSRYADQHVEFHFVNITSPSVRRTLIVAGFGTQPRTLPHPDDGSSSDILTGPTEILPVVPNSKDGPHHQHEESIRTRQKQSDIEADGSSFGDQKHRPIPLPRDKYPFFHWSSDDAMNAALESLAHRPPENIHDIVLSKEDVHEAQK
ncbi:sulfate transporter family-domain-containing protein [Dichotomocladium elegans]|nr:sulfate transporter family-domain-containing protein [Dichotomocladium elegans]